MEEDAETVRSSVPVFDNITSTVDDSPGSIIVIAEGISIETERCSPITKECVKTLVMSLSAS